MVPAGKGAIGDLLNPSIPGAVAEQNLILAVAIGVGILIGLVSNRR
jgi:hypothetical protein